MPWEVIYFFIALFCPVFYKIIILRKCMPICVSSYVFNTNVKDFIGLFYLLLQIFFRLNQSSAFLRIICFSAIGLQFCSVFVDSIYLSGFRSSTWSQVSGQLLKQSLCREFLMNCFELHLLHSIFSVIIFNYFFCVHALPQDT